MVDLHSDQDVSRVVFYNRNDCCQDRADGALLQLLDANHNVLETRTLSQALVQPFTFAARPAATSKVYLFLSSL
jgi:hypothetical protein